MGNLSGVVGYLKNELAKAQQEVNRFTAALEALGSSGSTGNHTLSASARKENQLGTEKEMGTGSEWIEASSRDSESDGFCTRKAHDVSRSPQEDRSRSKEAMGELQSGEEGGVRNSPRIEPTASVAGLSRC